jgi:ribokinase
VREIAIKRGRAGVLLAVDGTCQSIATEAVEAIDTTAAGDAFNAGLAFALARGQGEADAIRFATATAAVSVTRAGAQPSMPTRETVEALLAPAPTTGA